VGQLDARQRVLARDGDAADVRVRRSGGMALLTATLAYRAVDPSGQELRSLDNRLSWVLREAGGRWQVVHEHTSVPIAHETGQGLFKRPPGVVKP
jgi:ketosteroid isomerase-like protein